MAHPDSVNPPFYWILMLLSAYDYDFTVGVRDSIKLVFKSMT